jgi:hypothetical protein
VFQTTVPIRSSKCSACDTSNEVVKFHKQHGLWQNLSLVQGHISLPPDPVLTLTTITHFIHVENATCDEQIAYKCARNEADILQSIWPYPVYTKDTTFVKFGG